MLSPNSWRGSFASGQTPAARVASDTYKARTILHSLPLLITPAEGLFIWSFKPSS